MLGLENIHVPPAWSEFGGDSGIRGTGGGARGYGGGNSNMVQREQEIMRQQHVTVGSMVGAEEIWTGRVDLRPLFSGRQLSVMQKYSCRGPFPAPPPGFSHLDITILVNRPLLSSQQVERWNPLELSVVRADRLPSKPVDPAVLKAQYAPTYVEVKIPAVMLVVTGAPPGGAGTGSSVCAV